MIKQYNKQNQMLIKLGIIFIMLVGILLRIYWVVTVPTEQLYDFKTYYDLAVNISQGRGHTLDGVPIAWQGSGYAYFLGIYFKIVGSSSEFCGKVLNIILSSSTLIISYFIYKKLFEKKILVVIALIITSVLPNLIAYNNVLGTETFFLFLLSLLICIQLYINQSLTKNIILGVLCGVCSLTKPFMLVYPVIICVTYWIEKKLLIEAIKSCLTILAVTFIIISPWTIRNYNLYNRFIPISYNSGYVLYINNNNSNTTGSWLNLSNVENNIEVKEKINSYLNNGEINIKQSHDIEPLLKSEAKQWIKDNPIEFMKLGVLRVKSTFFSGANDIFQWAMNGYEENNIDNLNVRNMNFIASIFNISIYILSSASFIILFAYVFEYAKLCFTKKQNNGQIPMKINIVFINMAFFVLISFIYEGQARYNFPTLIFMIISLVCLIENKKDKLE